MKKNRIFKLACTLLMATFLIFNNLSVIHADAYETFTIDAQIPENQIKPNVGYFDLLMERDKDQTLVVNIHNQGNEDMIALLEFNNASTGNNANKQFMTPGETDVSMKTPMKSFATLRENEIIVKAGQTVQAHLDVNMKDVDFDGVVLGGISVKANTLKDTDDKNKENISLENQITYLVGIQMRMNDVEIERNLNFIKTSTKLVNFFPTMIATIQNDKAVLMNEITIQGKVFKKGTETQVAQVNTVGNGILPNSRFDVVYDLRDPKIKAGEYTVKLKITHEDRVWEWEENLIIKDDEASNLNDEAVFTKTPINWVLIIGTFLIILLLIIIFLLLKRNKDDKENQEKKGNK